MGVTVTDPEEEQRAQLYASRLEEAMMEIAELRPTVEMMSEELSTCSQNLSYYKRLVEEELAPPPEIKYIISDEAFIVAVQEFGKTMSYGGVIRNHPGKVFVFFMMGYGMAMM